MGLLIRLGILILISMGILKTEETFFQREEQKIKEVKISGVEENFLKDFEFLKEELIGESFYKINIQKIRELLREDIRLEKAEITSKGLSSLNIYIERKKPKYYLQYKNKNFVVDKTSTIYGELNSEKITSLPFILLKDKKDFLGLIKILQKIEPIYEENISQIYIEDDYLVEVMLIDGGILKTNHLVEEEKYQVSKELYFELSKDKKISYIDVRFDDYIVKYTEDEDEK